MGGAAPPVWALDWRWWRLLVELHGGDVEARSPGLGQWQRIYRPSACFDRGDTGNEHDHAHAGRLAGRAQGLVVDDNCDAADSLCMLLNLAGAEVQRCL